MAKRKVTPTQAELEAAIPAGELVLLYQPQMTADGKTLAAVEALTRWEHPDHGLLGPENFIMLADRTGLIEPLGDWALRQACRDARRWPGLGIGVNVSPLQFRRPHFVDEVAAAIRAAGIPFDQVELEIVETAFFDDPDRAESSLRALRAFGVRIALDDFGTGYSSLSYLRRLPLDKLKVDKSFVDDIGSARSAAIVHALVALARAIGLKITAEGVETPEQQKFLRAAGCHYLQGFLFSRPVPAAEIDLLYKQYATQQPPLPPGAALGAKGVI